jgi:hypothetical protein
MEPEIVVVVVDFEQDFLAGDLDEAEIVLAEGVVVLIKKSS